MTPHTTDSILRIRVPIRLSASPGVEERGFASTTNGFLCASAGGPDTGFTTNNIRITGVEIEELVIGALRSGWQPMEVRFARPSSLEEIDAFLDGFRDALSIDLAPQQLDGWHANLHVDIPKTRLEILEPPRPPAIMSLGPVQMTRTHGAALSDDHLKRLVWTPLGQIFAEGMRSADPKMQYISWFVVLEELEKRKEFTFEPLFSKEEIAAMIKATPLSKQQAARLKGALSGRTVTTDGRADKLSTILAKIGLSTIATITGAVPVTPDLCREVIDQRNTVAHLGSSINEDVLHRLLFPLALGALAYLEGRPLPKMGRS